MNCVENLEGEIWRYVMSEEIGFYPYMVSNMGRVKSLNYGGTGDERLLKEGTNNGGYLYVNLHYKGRQIHFDTHRLVALMFIKNPDNLPCVNHKDEDKTNNFVENLEWCSIKYNINYGTGIERRRKTRRETLKTSEAWKKGVIKTAAKLSKQVFQYTTDGKLVNIYPSVSEVQKKTGFATSAICNCCNKKPKYKTAHGYIWSYEPIETSTNQLSLFPTTETEKN